MAATNVKAETGSDAFILTSSNFEKLVDIPNPTGEVFRLTITRGT
jgi:hypothetical protein